MPNYLLIASCFLIIGCSSPKTEIPEVVPGVSEELASFRSEQIDSIVYDLQFTIPEKLADSIPARLDLSLYLKASNAPLVLDFQPNHDYPVTGTVNGEAITMLVEQEHIVIPNDRLQKGKNQIKLDFIAGERSLNRNEEYLFTLLVPDRARTLFPCFDQPNLKAKYRLQVTTPESWKVLGPSKLIEEKMEGQQKTYRFGLSEPMSTYLFSFVAGTFESVTHESQDFPMTLFHMETDSIKAKESIPAIFDLHLQSKDFLQTYTERAFPFQKLDYAAIYSHPYGGMEHVGAIQYLQQSLFLDSTATERQRLGRAKLIAHETAHMWFGDLVTMEWFDDVWMKEVFANFMADKIVNPVFTEVNHDLQFLTGHYPSAFSVDRTAGANPIRQHLGNLNNAGSLYGDIIYHKAPIMMRQLEALLGEEAFRKGMARYMAAYPYGNADWNDLIAILDEASPMDLKNWSEVWVHTSGRPIFQSDISVSDGKIQKFELTQEAEDGDSRLWPQVFEISLHYADSVKTLSIAATKKQTMVSELIGFPEPLHVTYNSDGMGYGVFPVDESLTDYAFYKKELERGWAYINLYENVLIGNVSVEKASDIFQKSLAQESNELLLGLISGYVGTLFWTYTKPATKEKLQPELEGLLFNRLQSEEASNIKKTIYNLYRSIAYDGIGRDRLYGIWTKEISIPKLHLNQDDYTSLAMTLALYEHPNSEEILVAAEEALSNPNKKERFQFLRPALSADPEMRNSFFKSFAIEKNREKERWVSTACRYIHHPLRQEESIGEVALSLELLQEIQATGDIFFPKSWLGSTIGQYTSEEAYEVVQQFLNTHTEMDPKLRDKVLQSTDHLSRIVQGKVELY